MYQGILRLTLAFIVVLFHFFPTGPMPGRIAVFSFYLISGYLVTRIINERYTGADGLGRFAVNQFLRLYPTYLSVLLFSLVIISLSTSYGGGSGVLATNDLTLPGNADAWLRQFTIVGLTQWSGDLYPVRLVPVGFSLAIEIVHYVLIALLLGRSARATGIWWLTGLAIAIWMIARKDFAGAFLTYWGPTIMFASGAAMYHGREKLAELEFLCRRAMPLALFFTIALVVYSFSPALVVLVDVARGASLVEVRKEFADPSVAMLYLSMPLSFFSFFFCIMVVPSGTAWGWRGRKMASISDFCGDISYPLFLVHLPAAALLSFLLPALAASYVRIGAILSSLLLSALLVLAIERPLKSIRARVRPPGNSRRTVEGGQVARST